MKKIFIVVFVFVFVTCNLKSQSLIVGIPSADVAEKNHLEITHESQWNFVENPQKWNSFNFACYGLGNGLELTTTLNNLNNEGSNNLALGVGGKKVFNLFKNNDAKERKFIFGSNLLYSTVKSNFGIWSYALYSTRIPNLKTRLTGGFSYGGFHTFGYNVTKINNVSNLTPNNKFVFLGGLEQPLFKNVSFICDWYSGQHDLAAFIPAMQFDIGHNVFILGYKLPNNNIAADRALIIEFMISIPTKKEKKRK